MGQVGKFFQNQRPKKACRAQGRGGAGDDAVWFLVWVCSHACTRMESRLVPCTRLGLGVQSCQWRWRFWEKKPTGYLYRAGFLVSQVGSVLKESAEVSKNQTSGAKSKASSCPRSKFFKCTQVLLSDIEKPHPGRADKKVVVKELCLYDDIAPVGENQEGKESECHRPRHHLHTWCPFGFSGLGTCTTQSLTLGHHNPCSVRCGGAYP